MVGRPLKTRTITMTEDLENKNVQNEQNESNREGYSSASPSGYAKQNQNGATGRPQRPRIHTQRAYSSNGTSGNSAEGGFRPEGFGNSLASNESGQYRSNYRPRVNNNYGGGYQSRQGSYQSRPQQGGYRPRYNSNSEEGGYQPRQNNYQQRGGYQSRP